MAFMVSPIRTLILQNSAATFLPATPTNGCLLREEPVFSGEQRRCGRNFAPPFRRLIRTRRKPGWHGWIARLFRPRRLHLFLLADSWHSNTFLRSPQRLISTKELAAATSLRGSGNSMRPFEKAHGQFLG